MTEHSTEVVQRPTGALAVRPNQTDWTPDQRAALEAMGIDQSVTAGDLKVFLTYSQRTGLDPWSRQIYLIKRNSKDKNGNWQTRWAIQCGIDGFRVIANRSAKYRGQTPAQWCGPDGLWVDVWLADHPPAAARAGVLHADWEQPLYAVAKWSTYAALNDRNQPTGTWAKMPDLMLHKCAEALALRRAFPQDLSGMYIAEEMDQRGPAELTTPAEPREVADIVGDAAEAEDLATLQALWREAAAARLLDEATAVDAGSGEVTETLRDLLMARSAKLQPDAVTIPQDTP